MARKQMIAVTVHKDRLFDLLKDLQRTNGPHFRSAIGIDFQVTFGWVGDKETEDLLVVYLHEDTIQAMMNKLTLDAFKARYREA
jgi:hypothetical protein